MAFVGTKSLVISDESGNLIILKNVHKQKKLSMNLIKTKFPRIREVKSSFSEINNRYNFLAAISTDCKLALWSCKDLLSFEKDLEDLKPARIVKSK